VKRGGILDIVRDIKKYKFFLVNFVKYELKLRYKNTKLGFLWVFLSPLLYFALFAFIFSFVIRGGMKNYKLFFLSGLVPWMILNNTILTQIPAVINNSELFKKVAVPKFIFPLSVNIARYVDNFVFLLILFLIFLLSGGKLLLIHLWVIPILFLFFMTTMSVGIIFSVINVFFRDWEYIVNILFQVLFFSLPIIYPLNLIPQKLRFIFKLNPFYYYIEVFHTLFYYQRNIFKSHLLIITIVSFSLLILSLGVIYYSENKIIFRLSD